MNIVFICGGFYPDADAVGNCVRQIALKCVNTQYSVFVICKSYSGKSCVETIDNIEIHRIDIKRLNDWCKLKDNTDSIIKKIRIFYHKAKWALYNLGMVDGMENNLVEAYLNELVSLNSTIGIDIIVPACMPAESLKATLLYSCDNFVKIYPLLYDLYSDNKDFFRFRWNQKLRAKSARAIEEKIFARTNRIFYVDNWDEYFKKNKYANAVRVEHPLVVSRPLHPIPLTKANEINLIYQGELNYQMRPATLMLAYFEKLLSKHHKLSLHICAWGNGTSAVVAASQRNPNNIIYYGRVDKNNADGLYDAADVAVIIANKNPSIVPSKIFECVVSGYPIVYFYYTKEEKSYELLKKYPLVYFVDQSNHFDEYEQENLYCWLKDCYTKRVDLKVVKDLYSDATPDFIVSAIENKGD